jgi:predicted nuclease with TOPRIM domain
MQAEVDRMNVENKRLRVMLNQVNDNYNSLQMHFATLMQEQQTQKAKRRINDEVIIILYNYNEERSSCISIWLSY